MSKKILIDLDFNSVAKVVNLPTPTSSGDAATKGYVDSAVEGLAWKDSVRAASTANINLSSPGASIDGITMSSGDRFLAKDQSTTSQNGIYIWNGAATPATRASDASTGAELEQAVVVAEEGTSNGATTWRQTQVNFTIDSGANLWTAFGTSAPSASETVQGIIEIATQAETDAGSDDARAITPAKLAAWSGKPKRYAANIGDNSNTQIAVTHNLGTRDVTVDVVRNSTPWDNVECDIERTDTNTVTLRFAAAPTTNQYRVVVVG